MPCHSKNRNLIFIELLISVSFSLIKVVVGLTVYKDQKYVEPCRDRDRLVVGCTSTDAINAQHCKNLEL